MTEKPQLIVSVSGKAQPVNYVCSMCQRVFPLPNERSPKEVMAAIYLRFKRHVEQEHQRSGENLPITSERPTMTGKEEGGEA
jgi:hypothetical protein